MFYDDDEDDDYCKHGIHLDSYCIICSNFLDNDEEEDDDE